MCSAQGGLRDGPEWQKPAGTGTFQLEGMPYAEAWDQRVFLVAEARGTRKELGWNRRKREAEITAFPLSPCWL